MILHMNGLPHGVEAGSAFTVYDKHCCAACGCCDNGYGFFLSVYVSVMQTNRTQDRQI
jgi:hypothetical protein